MPMYGRIKISKRVKNKLPMVQPGMRDNSILPSSGGASNSGITLDYSAINMGGIDNGIPYNHTDDMTDEELILDLQREQANDNLPAEQKDYIEGTKQVDDIYKDKVEQVNHIGMYLWKLEARFDKIGLTAEEQSRYEKLLAMYSEALDEVATMLASNNYNQYVHKQYKIMEEHKELFSKTLAEIKSQGNATDDNKARGAFVGSHEEGFELRHNLDYGSTANLTALIIKGNAKFVIDNATAEEFYDAVANYLLGLGYKVSFDASETKGLPHKADLIIGHSNGLFKLNRCSDNAKLIAIGAIPEKATNPNIIFANHPVDEQYLKKCHASNRYDYPIAEHFIFTDEMKTTIDNATIALWKKAFPDWPQYSDPQMYQQVMERPDANVTPMFNIFETYYADDGYPQLSARGPLQRERPKVEELIGARGPLQRERPKAQEELIGLRGPLQRERPKPSAADDVIEVVEEPETIEVIDSDFNKRAFIKTAVTYDSNPVIQSLISIPEVKSLIEQNASGFVDKIIVTTPSADVQQTKQQLSAKPSSVGMAPITLEPISGDPYGHVWVGEDPTTHQKKPLDKIVRIDRVTDKWGTLVTILHEIGHHRHPDWSESQVESEAENLAGTVKQHLGATKDASGKTNLFFVKRGKLYITPMVSCDLADTYQKQVIGLQSHSSLRPQHGLLFTYAVQQPLTFWMGKVSFPIDIIFANQDNQIVKIYRNCQPKSADLYTCDKASKVIEVVGSFCAFHDIDVGDHVFYADDDNFTKHLFETLKGLKVEQQKDLDMTDWNIKIVMKRQPDSRRFLKVSWTPEDYKLKKADILVNPSPALIEEALKEMPMEKIIRHSLLHILAGAKNELPEDKEQKLITNKLY